MLLFLSACIETGLIDQDGDKPAFDSGEPAAIETATDTEETADTGASDDSVDVPQETADSPEVDTVDTVGETAVDTEVDTEPDPPGVIDVEGVCTGGYPYTEWSDAAATEPELHIIGVYESQAGSGGPVSVVVTRTAEIVLVLTSYSSVDWRVDLDAAHQVDEVLVSSYEPTTVTFTGAGTAPVVDVGWIGACGYEIPDMDPYSGCETPDLQAIVEARTGLAMASFQGCYAGGDYVVGG